MEINVAKLALMLEGIELTGAKRRKRYRRQPTSKEVQPESRFYGKRLDLHQPP